MTMRSGICCMVLALAGATSPPAPLFMWSPKEYFAQSSCDQAENNDGINLHIVQKNIQMLGRGTPTALLSAAKAGPPEVVLAVVYPGLTSQSFAQLAGAYSTDDASSSFSYLEPALKSSSSCVLFSNLKAAGQSVTQALRQSFAGAKALQLPSLPSSSSSSSSSSSLPSSGGCTAILNALDAQSALFADGATQLLLLPPDAADACMGAVLASLETKTDGKFVAIVAAESAASPITARYRQPTAHQRSLLAVGGFQLETNATVTGIQYVNAPIISGLSIGFLLLMFLYIGVGCLMGIQAPARFASAPLPVPKES